MRQRKVILRCKLAIAVSAVLTGSTWANESPQNTSQRTMIVWASDHRFVVRLMKKRWFRTLAEAS